MFENPTFGDWYRCDEVMVFVMLYGQSQELHCLDDPVGCGDSSMINGTHPRCVLLECHLLFWESRALS